MFQKLLFITPPLFCVAAKLSANNSSTAKAESSSEDEDSSSEEEEVSGKVVSSHLCCLYWKGYILWEVNYECKTDYLAYILGFLKKYLFRCIQKCFCFNMK